MNSVDLKFKKINFLILFLIDVSLHKPNFRKYKKILVVYYFNTSRQGLKMYY